MNKIFQLQLIQEYLSLRDGGHELDDAIRDGLLELKAAFFPKESG